MKEHKIKFLLLSTCVFQLQCSDSKSAAEYAYFVFPHIPGKSCQPQSIYTGPLVKARDIRPNQKAKVGGRQPLAGQVHKYDKQNFQINLNAASITPRKRNTQLAPRVLVSSKYQGMSTPSQNDINEAVIGFAMFLESVAQSNRVRERD